MREIKFRAWDNKEKKWLLGYEYPNLGGFSLFGECMLMDAWSQVLNEYILNCERYGHSQDDLIVMQYTGLKDKNGREIYEGDILREIPNEGFDPNPPWVVEWYVYDIHCGWNTEPCDTWYSEVIGNIYENPELLEEMI